MRRLALSLAAFAALLVPVVAGANADAIDDGSLVVKNGAAPLDTPVVQLKITGSVIGRVADQGTIIIDPGLTCSTDPQVVGAGRALDVKGFPTASKWTGNNFTFRAVGVGCTFTILVYGSQVNLVASGKGKVRLAGMPDTPHGDGAYSLNNADFRSLPGQLSAKLSVGSDG